MKASKLPVLRQLYTMKVPPFQNMRERTTRKGADDDAIGDTYRDLLVSVARVKMWRIVLVVVDHNYDTEKAADGWHRHDSIGKFRTVGTQKRAT